MRALILAATILLSSCSSVTPVKLPLPNQPDYPVLTHEEALKFDTLPETIRRKLILRDMLKTEHIKELEDIISSTR